jgi:Ni/Co efflux regulator RcnB
VTVSLTRLESWLLKYCKYMRLLIDKENLLSLIRQSDHPLHQDAETVMLTQLDLELNFTEQEGHNDEALSMWLPILSEYKGKENNHYFLQPEEEAFELKNDVHLTWPRPHTGFLVNSEETTVKECQLSGQVLVYGLGKELDFFKAIFLGYPYREFHRPLLIGDTGFKKWGDLSKYVTPLTDIIIIDRFIADDPSTFEHNLLAMLKTLHFKKVSRTNIILLTDQLKIAGTIPQLIEKMKKAVASVSGCQASVTVVTWRHMKRADRQAQPHLKNFQEHDRTLITNYSRWKSGDSFNNYFTSQSECITDSRDFDMYSLARRENFKNAKKIIDDINRYLAYCKSKNLDHIFGDRNSGLLVIPKKN